MSTLNEKDPLVQFMMKSGHFSFFGKKGVKAPGSRGGKGYRDEKGVWQYGERPNARNTNDDHDPQGNDSDTFTMRDGTKVSRKALAEKNARFDTALTAQAKQDAAERENMPELGLLTSWERADYDEGGGISARVKKLIAGKSKAQILAMVDAKNKEDDESHKYDSYGSNNVRSEDNETDIEKSDDLELLNSRFKSQGPLVGDMFETVSKEGFSYKSLGTITEVLPNGMTKIEHAPYGEAIRTEYMHKGELVRSLDMGKIRLTKSAEPLMEESVQGAICRKCGKPEIAELPGVGYCKGCLNPVAHWW